MKNTYTNEISELQRWVEYTNENLRTGFLFLFTEAEVQMVCQRIHDITMQISDEYPFYASEFPVIMRTLFSGNTMSGFKLNPAAFGELFIITKQLVSEPINAQFWANIHPRIIRISRALFCDGHFDSAAEKAVREIETRLRELFCVLKPGTAVPTKVGDIIGALLSESGAFRFCDTSSVSGKDYRRGVKSLFEGVFTAYRNPAAHANLPCSKREAIEQITLASQLMYILDKPQLP